MALLNEGRNLSGGYPASRKILGIGKIPVLEKYVIREGNFSLLFTIKVKMKYQKIYYLLSPSFYNPPAFQDVKFVVLFWNMKPVWADFRSFHKYCDRKYLPMLQSKNSINLVSR